MLCLNGVRMALATRTSLFLQRWASGRSYEDSSPYKVLSQVPQAETDEIGFFKRHWVEPKSVLDQTMVARLCTGKYRTTWKEAALMKDPISLVQYSPVVAEGAAEDHLRPWHMRRGKCALVFRSMPCSGSRRHHSRYH